MCSGCNNLWLMRASPCCCLFHCFAHPFFITGSVPRCEITGAADGSTSFVYTAVSQPVVEQAIQHWNSALTQLEQCAGKALKNLGQYWRGTVLKKEQAPHGGGVKNHLWHSAWIKLTFSRSLRWCVQKWNCRHSSCQGEKPVTHWGYRPWTQVDESWNR